MPISLPNPVRRTPPNSTRQPSSLDHRLMSGIAVERGEGHPPAVQVSLDGPTSELRVEVLGQTVAPSDGQKLGLEVLAEDAGLLIAKAPRDGSPPENAINVDRTTGNDLRPRPHGSDHRHVAVRELDGLAGANRRGDHQRRDGRTSGCALLCSFGLLR
jgi:hypothetical protein